MLYTHLDSFEAIVVDPRRSEGRMLLIVGCGSTAVENHYSPMRETILGFPTVVDSTVTI